MNQIQLGIIEDEPLVLETLETFLSKQVDINVALTSSSVEGFLKNLDDRTHIDMVLLDIGLPGLSGLEGIPLLQKKRSELDIVILTSSDDSEKVFQALCAGAVSYISKRTDLPTIKEALVTVHRGGSYMSPTIARQVIQHFVPNRNRPKEVLEALTPRQEQIARSLIEGLSYKMIADRYDISMETVRDHIKKIYKKLQINSKMELISKLP
ncbi:MAG TPA: response regulator transcription factor [Saprospiraceae bacterium]|nr:response regulator transcription factor [Saprospiraceae bacterium]HMP24841.1 response regulator transcription factor [Saprospiraceae bacterium]